MAFKKDSKGDIARNTFSWDDTAKGENVMWRVPRNLHLNDNIVVKEDEYAVFFRDGKAMHVFDTPGRVSVTTLNVPILTKIVAGLTGIKQLGEVYYVQRREMRGKFGTSEPLAFRDNEFGMIRIRMFGRFSYKVKDPLLFISQFVGTEGRAHSAEVVDWMKEQLVMGLNDAIGELKRDTQLSILDLPAYLMEIEQIVLQKIKDDTMRYGIEITKLAGLNLNLPTEVQEAIDKRGAMGALGVNYMQMQAGKAMETAAGNTSGAGALAGAGVGLGAGLGMGAAMGGSMTQGMEQNAPMAASAQPNAAAATTAAVVATIACLSCTKPMNKDAKFCPHCGAQTVSESKQACIKCSKDIAQGAKFCPECGSSQEKPKCPKCGAESSGKFCPECGVDITA